MAAARGSWLGLVVIGLAAVGGWLAATPYIGIDHDSVLYVVGAMRRLSPEAYLNDPFFIDAQDDRTLYSPVLGLFLRLFDVAHGAMAATLVNGLLFLLSAHVFSGRVMRGPGRYLVFLAWVTVPLAYGAQQVFYVSEGFVTARGVAVPLSLLGLAAVMARRHALAALAFAGAFLFHPIMALPAMAVGLLAGAGRQGIRLLMVGVVGLVLIFAMAAAGWLTAVDGTWMANLRHDQLVFVSSWLEGEGEYFARVLGVLIIAARLGRRTMRPIYAYTAVVATVGVGVSLWAANWIHPAIVLGAQTWRAMWLADWVAVVAVCDVVLCHMVRRHAPARLLALLVVALVVAAGDHKGWALLAIGPLLWVWRRCPIQMCESRLRRYQPLGHMFAILAIALRVPAYLAGAAEMAEEHLGSGPVLQVLDGLFRTGGFGLLAWGAWICSRRAPKAAVLPLFAYAAYATAHWDVQPAERAAWEASYSIDGSKSHFRDIVPRGAVVYWHGATERVWFEMATSGYASRRHVNGIVFSKRRTDMLIPRMERVLMASADESLFRRFRNADELLAHYRRQMPDFLAEHSGKLFPKAGILSSYERVAPLTHLGIRHLCADPALDFVVDPLLIEGAATASFEEQVEKRRVKWYLYRCSDLRA